jgi:YfaZ precursor
MRTQQAWKLSALLLACAAAAGARAQSPVAPSTHAAFDATVGNQVVQLRYTSDSPLGVGNNVSYGALFTESREFIASAALLFDTELVPLDRLRLQVGPELNAAWLEAGQKTDVFAAALGASARYELIRRIGLSAFGSAFYSPGVLTLGSAHNMYDFTAGAEARLSGRLYLLGGYRWLKFTLVNQPDEKVANELFGGIRWQLQ